MIIRFFSLSVVALDVRECVSVSVCDEKPNDEFQDDKHKVNERITTERIDVIYFNSKISVFADVGSGAVVHS